MDRLNFNHLFYFYIVAKEGSIKEAASKIHVSQPTISDQIKLLEEHFDCTLFDRKNRSLSLNRQGKLALEYAEKIFDLSKEVTSRLRNKVSLPKSSVDIGISQSLSHYYLFDTIEPLFEQDKYSVKIKDDQRHLLLADLEEGNLDVVFTDTLEQVSPQWEVFELGFERTFAVCHKKLKKKKSFPGSLNEIPFFHYTSSSSIKYQIDLYFSKNGLTPKMIGEADDVDLFQIIVDKGFGFVIVPEVAKNRFCMNKNVVSLGEIEELKTSVYAIMKNDYRGLFYDFLKEKYGPHKGP